MLTTLTFLATSPALAAGAQPVTPDFEGNCQSPRWNRDGTQLAYEVNFHDKKSIETWIFTPGEGERRISTASRGASAVTEGFQKSESGMVVHELTWGPEDYFIYSASGADQRYDLYLSSGSAIAPSASADGGPAWSPDGKWIAFTSARSGQGDVYLLSAAHLELEPQQISKDPTASELYLSWSADSSKLAWVGHTKQGDTIHLVDDLIHPKGHTIAALGNTQTRPSFSPDGERIAFYSNHSHKDRMDLYVLDLSVGSPRLVAEDVVMNFGGPQWSPGGEGIVYVKDDDDRFDPVFYAPVGGDAHTLLDTRTVGNGDHDIVVGTDGKTYLAVAAQGRVDDEVRDFKRIYVLPLDL